MTTALLIDRICRRWPGYTLSSALAEDASLLLQTLELVDLAKRGDDGREDEEEPATDGE